MTDDDRTALENEFTLKLLADYREAVQACNYEATAFLRMIGDSGGVGACRRLLATDSPSEGFRRLWECRRLDLTFEAAIWDNPRWHSLFNPEELTEAHRRLDELGYFTQDQANP